MNKLIKKYNIENKFTTIPKKQKKFNHFKNSVPPVKNKNEMCDLLYLPTTKEGFKYLLTIIDLANNACDFEPLKTHSSDEVLEAIKKIWNRKFIKQAEVSLSTDGGKEFQNRFDNYLKKNNIYHKVSLPYRHTQQAPIECLNNKISYVLNAYMNYKELQTKKQYNDWTDTINDLRKDLNTPDFVKPLPTAPINFPKLNYDGIIDNTPKYKIGDLVHIKLDYPRNALNNKQTTANFRQGDFRFNVETSKIEDIYYYPDEPYFRYKVSGIKNASFSEYQLMPSSDKEETHFIKKIIGKKVVSKKIYYLVWWRNELKKNATWEPKTNLIEDGVIGLINLFEDSLKK